MRLASFNVNSIRRRVPHVRRFLDRHAPDLLFLQELKCRTEEFPALEFEGSGYRVHAIGQPGGRNGVAVLGRIPFEVRLERLPGGEDDAQARYVEVLAGGVHVGGLYLPNGNSGGEEGFGYKLRWMMRLIAHARDRLDDFSPLALIGDFNVCPTAADLAPRTLPADNALVRPESRAAWRTLGHLGFTDAARALQPADASYTFWDYGPSFEANRGLRIDHVLLSPELAERLLAFDVDLDTRAAEQPSDHAPIWCDLASE